jgi:hypothetical protein
MEKHVEDRGRLSLNESVIGYQSRFYRAWSLDTSDLRLIGEYTNEDGPHASDHFLVFFGKNDIIHEAPVGAQGVSTVFEGLRQKLDGSVKSSRQTTIRNWPWANRIAPTAGDYAGVA